MVSLRPPKISVVVNTYNYGHFVEKAIESVLAQDLPREDFEVIVIDDGSTDDTRRQIKRFKHEIRYLYQENGGQASALNTGFDLARGELVTLLDGDDTYSRNRLSEIVKEFEKYPEVVTVLNCKTITNSKSSLVEMASEFHNLHLTYESSALFRNCVFGTGNFSFRRSVLKTLLPIPTELRVCADIYLTAMIWLGAVSSLNRPLYDYRIHSENLWFYWGDRNLEMKKRCLEKAIMATTEVLARLPNYKPVLTEMILDRYSVWHEELEVIDKFRAKRLRRWDLVRYEWNRMKLYWRTWRWRYRFYQALRFPIFVLLPADWVWKLKRWYAAHEIYRYRKHVFPD